MAFEFINEALAKQQVEGLLRQRQAVDSASARTLSVAGNHYINFASNDYLGLAQNLDITQLSQLQSGSRSSALVTGYLDIHRQLESRLCQLLGYQSALLFGSGFSANCSVIKTLFSPLGKGNNAAVFQDKLNHASLIDGSLAANAKLERFNHNDVNHLRSRLERSNARDKLIVTEGVFSMDGDTAPLQEIVALAQQHQAWLMLDDAHGFGVVGESGLGSTYALDNKPEILIITFGKAMGCQGAAVLASDAVINYMVQFNREFIYTTALSPVLSAIALAQLEQLTDAHEQRQRLHDNIALFKSLATSAGLALIPSDTAIQPIILGSSDNVITAQQALQARGFWVGAIRPPTVPQNTARLRVTITAAHHHDDITGLVATLKEVA
ncbi:MULTISPECIES: aminotransferase class I/II-fold pyridoxal phosphate-dependent enzyme [unclassified Pseudoalteromonas]|uniref:aminotransferase class I/II-fold pyridoxal phosphate-dependent enzyme n=1 Tax=unclassified Pseudoalteromonas TaxID=194690 RepID=UPI00301500B0